MRAFIRRHLHVPGPALASSGTGPVRVADATTAAPENNQGNSTEPIPPSDARDQSPPRIFPSSGFDLIEQTEKFEEETFSWYSVKSFYPVAIGEVFQNRYQVVAKLGYGTASTTWLCRDLRSHCYITLKVYASSESQTAREVAALEHLNSVLARPRHAMPIGATSIRTLLDQFRISRPRSSRANLCLVFKPLGVSLADVRKLAFDGRMPLGLVKAVAFYMLQALDFLHREANLVHADVQEDNIMFAVEQGSDWRAVEESEITEPGPRKVYKDHTIHATTLLEFTPTVPVLCDFGEARFGRESYAEHAMPDLCRAPEILLGLDWTEKIDIWALGLMLWTLVQGANLYTNNQGGRWKSALPHMARTISLLGPPPQDMLDMTNATKEYFDKKGQLKKGHKVVGTSLEVEATTLEGEAKADFLRFLRRILQWDPNDRPSAQELLKDPWLVISEESESEEEEEEDL